MTENLIREESRSYLDQCESDFGVEKPKVGVETVEVGVESPKVGVEVGLLVREGTTKNGRWIVCTGNKNVGVAAPYPPSRRRVAERCPSRGADTKNAKVAKKRKGGRARSPSAPR